MTRPPITVPAILTVLATVLASVLATVAALVTSSTVLLSPATAGQAPAGQRPPLERTVEPPTPRTGSFLTVISRGPMRRFGIQPRHQALTLVDRSGDLHTILARDVRRNGTGGISLADWSPDGSTALLLADEGRSTQRALAVDIATGSLRSTEVPSDAVSIVLDPSGSGIVVLAIGDDGENAPQGYRLYRLDWSGARTPLPHLVDGPILPMPTRTGAGAVLAGGGSYRSHLMRLLDLGDGHLIRTIRTPGAHCEPVRLWAGRRVLVSCFLGRGPRLGLVDTATGSMRWLTLRRPPGSRDLGDLDARWLRGTLYLEASGPCGVVFLARQTQGRDARPVRVPDSVGNILLLGVRGPRLVLQHAISCDGAKPRAAVGLFDPATERERLLVVLPRHEGFDDLRPFGEQQASTY